MKKVCVIITARPSYSRIKSALSYLKTAKNVELQIVVTSSALLSRYGNVVQTIEADGFEVSSTVYSVLDGETLSNSVQNVGLCLIHLSSVLLNLKPDLVVTIADRYETISNAIAASYMGIPLVHIQGGEVTGSIDNKVRHAITKLADYHLVASDNARDRVISMGEPLDRVVVTGCPSMDLAINLDTSDQNLSTIFQKYKGTGSELCYSKPYIVVMQHPVTYESDDAMAQISATIAAVQRFNLQTFWFWPNVDSGSDESSKRLRILQSNLNDSKIRFVTNMQPTDFLTLLKRSSALIGNSSVGVRECSFLGVPVVNIGSRQQLRDRGANVFDVKEFCENKILLALEKAVATGHFDPDYRYGDGHAGKSIAEFIQGLEPSISV